MGLHDVIRHTSRVVHRAAAGEAMIISGEEDTAAVLAEQRADRLA